MDFSKERSCDNKRKYHNRGHALKMMHKLDRMYLWPYQCDFCKSWHLGRPPGFKKRQNKLLKSLGIKKKDLIS